MIRRQINNKITLDLNLLHHQVLDLNSDCFNYLLVDSVAGLRFLVIVVTILAIVVPDLATDRLVVATAEQVAIIVERQAVVVIAGLVVAIVAVRQRFVLEAAPLHHQRQSRTNS